MARKRVVKKSTTTKGLPKNWQPLWNPTLGITQTLLGHFLQCREQFRLRWLEGWRPSETTEALDFGSAFHDCLAQVHQHGRSPRDAMTQYKRSIGIGKMTLRERQELESTLGQVLILLEAYQKEWSRFDSTTEWVAREKSFNFGFTVNTSMLVNNPTPVNLRGKWDGVFRSGKGCPLRILETKTKSRIDEDGIQDSLPFDLQTMFYAYAAQCTFGERVGGILYDVVRRPQLRQKQDESLPDFLARVAKDVELRRDFYFFRWDVSLGKDDVDNWVQRTLTPIISELLDWYDTVMASYHKQGDPWGSPLHYMNPNGLFTRYGRCDLFDALTKGDYSGLRKAKTCHEEL